MAVIPVYCGDCKILFSSGIYLEKSEAKLNDNFTSCPKCETKIPIPNGIYTERENVLSVLNSQNDTFFNGIIGIANASFSDDLKLKLIDQLFLYNSGQSLTDTLENTGKQFNYDSKAILIYFFRLLKGLSAITSGLKAIEWIADKF